MSKFKSPPTQCATNFKPESFEVASDIVNKERVSQTDILPLKVHGILSAIISDSYLDDWIAIGKLEEMC